MLFCLIGEETSLHDRQGLGPVRATHTTSRMSAEGQEYENFERANQSSIMSLAFWLGISPLAFEGLSSDDSFDGID